jgi:hypothetical protein
VLPAEVEERLLVRYQQANARVMAAHRATVIYYARHLYLPQHRRRRMDRFVAKALRDWARVPHPPAHRLCSGCFGWGLADADTGPWHHFDGLCRHSIHERCLRRHQWYWMLNHHPEEEPPWPEDNCPFAHNGGGADEPLWDANGMAALGIHAWFEAPYMPPSNYFE